MTARARFRVDLDGAATLWDVTCLLLETWRAALPAVPARDDVDDPYSDWAMLRDETYDRFATGRAAADLDEDDRRFVAERTDEGQHADRVDAVAWGLATSCNHTFAESWFPALGKPDTHALAPGEPYPVVDPLWPFPVGDLTPRPDSLTRPRLGELPFVRVHEGDTFDVTVDFRFRSRLKRILRAPGPFAALHPNDRWDELAFRIDGGQCFPVRPTDGQEQYRRIRRLVEGAIDEGVGVAVLPELCLTAADVLELQKVLEDVDAPLLLVAGSYHARAGGVNANVATGLVSGRTERMTHRKTIPFADELGKPPAFKEGIPHVRRPHLTVFHADRFRVGLVVCKELLDTGPLRDALDRSGVNVLLVPAMSEKTAPFRTAAAARVEAAQAITFVVNGPLRGQKGAGIAPAIVVGQPIEGRTSAGFIPRRAERVTKMPIPLPPSVPAPAACP